jgi:sulfate permease, SulP family
VGEQVEIWKTHDVSHTCNRHLTDNTPMIALLEAHRENLLSRQHWSRNLLAGVVVGIVALPLAMAFAIASGARPEQGIYTAIIAGFAVSAFGGSRLQIAGPTGAFIVILSGITARYGIGGLQVATLMAGVILIALGATKMGSVIKYIPDPVIVGFTSGIAVIIWVGQWADFFGLKLTSSDEHFFQKLTHLIEAFPSLNPATTGLSMFTLACLIVFPHVPRLNRIPAPLTAMVVVTLVQAVMKLNGVATIGSAFGGIPQSLPSFHVPDVSLADAAKLVGPAFTIALLGAIESLLSAVVADGMANTRHDSNQELVGQGIANVLAPLFGGFAATGAIARTATNIRNGANSPLAGTVHALTLLMIVLLLAPYAAWIPLCTLSAILFVVAYNMSEMHRFRHMVRTAPGADVAILLITFVLTVFADLVVAVNVGVVLASLLFMRRMAQAVEINEESVSNGGGDGESTLPPGTMVYSIDGPFFFGAAEKLERTLEAVQQHMGTLVLRLGRVPFVDATGIQALNELAHDCRRFGTRLILCKVRPNVRMKLERAGVLALIGEENVVTDISEVQ